MDDLCSAAARNRRRAHLNPFSPAMRKRKMIGKIEPKRTRGGTLGWSNSIRATDPLIRIIALSKFHRAVTKWDVVAILHVDIALQP